MDEHIDAGNSEPGDEKVKSKNATFCCLGGVVGFFIFLFVIAYMAVSSTSFVTSQRITSMDRAVAALHAIARAQSVCREDREHGGYCTFEQLKEHGYIGADFTEDNMVDDYKLKLELSEQSDEFIVYAYPVKNSGGLLKTFAIMEDQIIRTFNPSHENVEEDVSTWDKGGPR